MIQADSHRFSMMQAKVFMSGSATNCRRPITIRLPNDEHQVFESILDELNKKGVRISKSELGRFIVKQFIDVNYNNVEQLVLDLRQPSNSERSFS